MNKEPRGDIVGREGDHGYRYRSLLEIAEQREIAPVDRPPSLELDNPEASEESDDEDARYVRECDAGVVQRPPGDWMMIGRLKARHG